MRYRSNEIKNKAARSRKSVKSDLLDPGFSLCELRKRINLGIAKAKFKALPKPERERRADEAIENISQLIK